MTMKDPEDHPFLGLLREMVEELNREAREVLVMDPLREVTFHLRQEGEAVEVVASYLSGHGGESAHVLEDRVRLRLRGREALDIRFEEAMNEVERIRRSSLSGGGDQALVGKIHDFLKGTLG